MLLCPTIIAVATCAGRETGALFYRPRPSLRMSIRDEAWIFQALEERVVDNGDERIAATLSGRSREGHRA